MLPFYDSVLVLQAEQPAQFEYQIPPRLHKYSHAYIFKASPSNGIVFNAFIVKSCNGSQIPFDSRCALC